MKQFFWFAIFCSLATTAHALSIAAPLPTQTPSSTRVTATTVATDDTDVGEISTTDDATDDPLTLLPTSPATQMRTMIGSGARDQEKISADFHLTFAIPARQEFAPLLLKGAGTVPFVMQGSLANITPKDVPTLRGSIAPLPGSHFLVECHAIPGAPITVGFTNGALNVTGLTWEAVVRATAQSEPLLRVTFPATILTTGTVTINHTPVHGAFNIDDRSATLVGVFTMPHTGLAPLDQKIAGQNVLASLRVTMKK